MFHSFDTATACMFNPYKFYSFFLQVSYEYHRLLGCIMRQVEGICFDSELYFTYHSNEVMSQVR
jgi:hypothetical protein